MTSSPSAWDDARLEAAFTARDGLVRSTPPDLAVSVIARVAARPAGPTVGFRRAAPGLGLAAAVVVAIAIGAGQLAQAPPAASSSPNASHAASTQAPPSRPPRASPAVEPSIVDELLANPISVSEAIARRDANLDDTEIAVVGFAWFPGAAIDCAIDQRVPATFGGCARRYTWLAEGAETRPNVVSPEPIGPAFNLFVQPDTFVWDQVGQAPTRVIALGHFDDHRAALCPADQIEACRRDFVVDWLIDPAKGVRSQGLVQVDPNAAILLRVNDAVTLAGLDVSDESIVAAFAIRTRALGSIDPGVVGAAELHGVNAVWFVRWIDDDQSTGPRLRTRLVLEDAPDRLGIASYEVTAAGLEPVAPPPATDPAFDGAPAQVVGLHVMEIRTAIERQSLLVRSEVAVRGWYVPPDPRATCAGQEPIIHAASPPCKEARHWLLEQPEPWPVAGTDGRPAGLFLEPAVPSDVPMPVPDTWADGTPEHWPVVVVGHFHDYRVGASRFIVDALVWQRGGTVTDGSSVTRLTPDATESPEAAIARVEDAFSPPDVSNRELGPPVLTWTSVVSAEQFGIMEPEISEAAPEFLDGPAVWIVRRLVSDRWDGQDRLIVDTAYTADGGSRVWLHRADFGEADLETTIDVGPFGEHTRKVEVRDYGQWIVSVRRATAADSLTWQPTNPKRDGIVEVARGATDRDVGIRWNGGACALDWQVQVKVELRADGPGLWIQPQTFGDFCDNPRDMVTRALVITFNRPIDLDRVRSHDGSCCG